MIEILFRPPVEEPALGIELAALIVEAVADLMADNGAHGAVVVRRVSTRIKIWRLQDGGGKIQRVLKGKIEGVYRLGGHPPLVPVDRLVELGELETVFKKLGSLRIAEGVPFDDFET